MKDLERLDGLFEGLLDDDERRLFVQAVKDHRAYRSYEGAGGFLGLAKVRLVRVPAIESKEGGWSTHQVQANLNLGNECRRYARKARAALESGGKDET